MPAARAYDTRDHLWGMPMYTFIRMYIYIYMYTYVRAQSSERFIFGPGQVLSARLATHNERRLTFRPATRQLSRFFSRSAHTLLLFRGRFNSSVTSIAGLLWESNYFRCVYTGVCLSSAYG